MKSVKQLSRWFAVVGILAAIALVELPQTQLSVAASTPSPAPIFAPIEDPGTLTPAAQRELKALGPNVVLVECAIGVKTLPVGITVSRTLGFWQTHPGFRTLSDGHCANDPSVTPQPFEPAVLP